MYSKKLKYQAYLEKFPNCPPEEYQEVDMTAFRWVHKPFTPDDFIPLHLSKEPPRMLDTDDKNCRGYGLSMFDSLSNASKKYNNELKRRRPKLQKYFIDDKGDSVVEIELVRDDGLFGHYEVGNFGHFTFHEYEMTNFTNKIVKIHNLD